MEEADRRIAQGGEHLGNGCGADAAGILAEGDIAHPMRAVLDVPVLPQIAGEASRADAARWEARDPEHRLLADQAGLGGHHPPVHLEDLLRARPRQIRREGRVKGDGGQGAGFVPAVAAIALRRPPPRRLAGGGGAIKTVVIASFKCGWLPLATIR